MRFFSRANERLSTKQHASPSHILFHALHSESPPTTTQQLYLLLQVVTAFSIPLTWPPPLVSFFNSFRLPARSLPSLVPPSDKPHNGTPGPATPLAARELACAHPRVHLPTPLPPLSVLPLVGEPVLLPRNHLTTLLSDPILPSHEGQAPGRRAAMDRTPRPRRPVPPCPPRRPCRPTARNSRRVRGRAAEKELAAGRRLGSPERRRRRQRQRHDGVTVWVPISPVGAAERPGRARRLAAVDAVPRPPARPDRLLLRVGATDTCVRAPRASRAPSEESPPRLELYAQ